MRKVVFWDWQYMVLLKLLREMQSAYRYVFEIFSEFRPVDFETQQSFCEHSVDCESYDFEKLDREKRMN